MKKYRKNARNIKPNLTLDIEKCEKKQEICDNLDTSHALEIAINFEEANEKPIISINNIQTQNPCKMYFFIR